MAKNRLCKFLRGPGGLMCKFPRGIGGLLCKFPRGAEGPVVVQALPAAYSHVLNKHHPSLPVSEIEQEKLGSEEKIFVKKIRMKAVFPTIPHIFYCNCLPLNLSGSESGSGSTGSTCFWASWFRIRILLSPSKNSEKNLDSYCL
jgi:hypothetical protein